MQIHQGSAITKTKGTDDMYTCVALYCFMTKICITEVKKQHYVTLKTNLTLKSRISPYFCLQDKFGGNFYTLAEGIMISVRSLQRSEGVGVFSDI